MLGVFSVLEKLRYYFLSSFAILVFYKITLLCIGGDWFVIYKYLNSLLYFLGKPFDVRSAMLADSCTPTG